MTGDYDNPGITPRFIEDLFKTLQGYKTLNEVKVTVYMVEIYMDILIDLL